MAETLRRARREGLRAGPAAIFGVAGETGAAPCFPKIVCGLSWQLLQTATAGAVCAARHPRNIRAISVQYQTGISPVSARYPR
ncbi:hypothetical protein [Burkholderia sp. Ax-1724]|uniref:hypothetical protein n=1 Tax=Burkholderia sp. Ax-1724 TaxID=2608336 RepID=UPI0014226814|nr:hypothetical protein [Burkholderia sp. Ax-1724]NIF54997.1 hypothetical protein [Burkholderia sp. Ax-1724]